MLKQSDKDMVRSSVTMRQVVQAYGYKINRSGNICCPFHGDKNPSMHIYTGTRGYYCFVCNAGGDVIDFVMRHDHLDFEQAVRHLAEMFGIPLSDGNAELSDAEREKIDRERRRRKAAERARKKAENDLKELGAKIVRYKAFRAEFEPLSSIWCGLTVIIEDMEQRWEGQYGEVYKRRSNGDKYHGLRCGLRIAHEDHPQIF